MNNTSYKVLITTSGLGQRLGDITKYTNKSLVRVGKKPTLSYIIESYDKNIELVITVRHFAKQVEDFVKIAYPDRKASFIKEKEQENVTNSLGLSMLKARKLLNCPFIFHACDTIVLDKIPSPDYNWTGGYKGNNSSQYSSFKTNKDTIRAINEKGELDSDFLHIGLVGIKDYKQFWQYLTNLYKTDPQDSSLNDCKVINEMLKNGSSFKVKEFKNWFDTGNVESLNDARKNIKDLFHNLDKLEESIFLFNKHVIKFHFDQKVAEDRVKRASLMKGLVPDIQQALGNFFKYKYVKGEVYSRVVTTNDFLNFLNWCKKKLWIKQNIDSKKVKRLCLDFYLNKTQSRINKFITENSFDDKEEIINGELVPKISDLIKKIDFDWLCESTGYRIHGDLILDNIIKTNKSYKLLDWRQNFAGELEFGDIYYDLAKLNHNLTVNHDVVSSNMFEVIKSENDISCDIYRKDNLVSCQQVLFKFIEDQGFDLKKVKLLTSLIWLNMSPLHHYPFNLFLFYYGKLNLYRILKEI